jgi:hypothetical protein
MNRRIKWIVIIKRETENPEIVPFDEDQEEMALEFMDKAGTQWSDTYLCEVIQGPGILHNKRQER